MIVVTSTVRTNPAPTRHRCYQAVAAMLLCAVPFVPLAQRSVQAVAPPHASDSATALPPVQWAQAAAHNEIDVINYSTAAPLRYRVRRRDAKGETVRQVIESRDGSVARLLERDGRPLTPDEDAAERSRLEDILQDPATFRRHVHQEDGSRAYAEELLRAMARAMRWHYTPGQPQLPNATEPAVVLDFEPDSAFKPASLVEDTLTGIAGRVWIDQRRQVMTRIEGHILHPVDYGWGGVLARIRSGGTVGLDQQAAPNHRWLYARLVEHVTIREVLVHTVEENVDMSAGDVQVQQPVSVEVAVQQLLALPVSTR